MIDSKTKHYFIVAFIATFGIYGLLLAVLFAIVYNLAELKKGTFYKGNITFDLIGLWSGFIIQLILFGKVWGFNPF